MTKALVEGYFGARGVGKTVSAMRALQRTPALAIWDYKHDPRMASWGTGYTDLAAFVKALEAKRFTARYLVDRGGPLSVTAQFEFFCRACFLRGNMTMFVDELPAVTRAWKAPDAWRECVNIGREYRDSHDASVKELGIVITAQRPGEVDKALIGNLDVIRSGRLPFANDARSIAGSLGVKYTELQQLPDLHYIERRAERVSATRGILTFPTSGSTPAKAPARRAA